MKHLSCEIYLLYKWLLSSLNTIIVILCRHEAISKRLDYMKMTCNYIWIYNYSILCCRLKVWVHICSHVFSITFSLFCIIFLLQFSYLFINFNVRKLLIVSMKHSIYSLRSLFEFRNVTSVYVYRVMSCIKMNDCGRERDRVCENVRPFHWISVSRAQNARQKAYKIWNLGIKTGMTVLFSI